MGFLSFLFRLGPEFLFRRLDFCVKKTWDAEVIFFLRRKKKLAFEFLRPEFLSIEKIASEVEAGFFHKKTILRTFKKISHIRRVRGFFLGAEFL